MVGQWALDSPQMQALIEKIATWPHGLGFLHLADLETLAIELRVDPFLLAAAREALETPEGRDFLIDAVRRARRCAGPAPAEPWAPPDEARPVSRPPALTPEELIEAARRDPLGLSFLVEGYPESVAVHFRVHPNVVFRARELLDSTEGGEHPERNV